MTKEEIQAIVSSAVSEMGDRRSDDNKETTRLTAIVAYLTIASFTGAIVLWVGDARIDQKTRAFSDRQIVLSETINHIHSDLKEIKDIVKKK
jgi:hypothetical protein